MVVPKKAQGKYRVIYHLFYSKGELPKAGVPDELCSEQYTSFDIASFLSSL